MTVQRNRVLVYAWMLVLVATLVGVLGHQTLRTYFSGAPVRLRPWLIMTHGMIGTGQVLAIAAMAWAVHQVHKKCTPVWIVAGLCALLATVYPSVIGEGPWAHDSFEMRTLTHFALLPAVVRDGALLWTTLSLGGRYMRPVVALLTVNLGLSIYAGWITPTAVIFYTHSALKMPWLMIPWLLASLLLMAGWLSRDRQANH